MIKKMICSAAIAVGLVGGAHASSFTDTYTGFYSFGDSLSDDGKFSQLFAPSFGGRFTNGLTWAERIEDQFIAAGRDTGNLALGGATAGDANLFPAGPLSTFAGQVATFTGALGLGFGLPTQVAPTPEFKPTPPSPGTNPLLSVWFGANDIFQGFDPIGAANSVADNIRALNSIDASVFDDFLVVRLPDIGATPAYAGDRSQAGTDATNAFNRQLSKNIEDLEDEGINIITFSAQTIFNRIIEDVDSGTFSFGIFDTMTPCTASMGAALTHDPTQPLPPSCLDAMIDPNTLLFADAVHPNATAHALFAEGIERRISVVPLPAGLPLMLTFVAGFGLMARRRAA